MRAGRPLLAAVTTALAALAIVAPAQAAFPGKPGQIAFGRSLAATNGDIFSMSPLGSGQTNLTNTAAINELEIEPSYSGDGRRIVYSRFLATSYEIYAANANGSGATNLTQNPANNDFAPSLSADGGRVAFVRFLTALDIFVMGADGSSPVNLTNSAITENNPAFSPDGKRIAFSRDPGGNEDINLMDADGSNVVNLTNSPGVGDDRPTWSPDGRQIAWRRFVGGNFDIWVMNADGSGAKQLTFDATAESFPAFAPDNSRILFARDTDSDSSTDEIYAMNLDGSGQVNLTNSGAGDNDNAPDWQPIPVKCGGKRSTQVGTAGKNKLVGTAQRDVISGLGGKDTIRGLGGNDILCGGGGPDRIAGGKGRGDRCIGGKALDRAAACERSKGI